MSKKPVLLNLEPDGYSRQAQKQLETRFQYLAYNWEGSLGEISPNVYAIIVRLGRQIGSELFDRLPGLKYIISATTGLDHIDLSEAQKRGIEVLSLRGETSFLHSITSTPEIAWGLLLSLVRNIPAAVSSVDRGEWNRDAFRGYQLSGRTLGIVGIGRTGKMVAGYAEAFGMKVLYYDPYVATEKYERILSLEDLLGRSGIVSLHVHLNEETRHLINAKMLKHTHPGAYLVNTSRGEICDEVALIKALKAGEIAGVATDVLSLELTDFRESPLFRARKEGLNVIITPHIGGATHDAMAAAEEFMAEKLLNEYKNTDGR